MKTFELTFQRIEYISTIIKAESKKEAREIVKNCGWDLDSESIDELENKHFKLVEVKN